MAERIKRKNYTIEEKLQVIEKVKSGVSKASIFRESGIPEGTIRGWVKEEEKLRSFVASVESDVGLQRKKVRVGEDNELDDCLYKWFIQKRSESVPVNGVILKAQALKFNNLLGGDNTFKASNGWLSRWKIRHGICQINMEGEAASSDINAASEFPNQLKNVIEKGGYCDEQLYNCDESALYYKLMPSKSLDVKKDAHKSGFKLNKDRVTLLFCTNKTGSHKLKPLCIGKSKSPRCFKHVNMNSLPVTYDNSSNACMTSAVFQKWFERDFVPSVKRHLRLKRLEEKALLLLDNCSAHPSDDILQSKDGKIKVMFLPKNTTALIQPLDQGIIHAFKAHYRGGLLSDMVNSELQVTEFLKTVTLKHAAYLIGLAWNKVSPTSIEHCWKKCIAKEENTNATDKMEIDAIIPECAIAIASSVLETRLQQDDFEDWLKVDEDIPVVNVLTDEEIAASVKRTDDCESQQAGVNVSDSEDDDVSNDSAPNLKVNDVIDKISEVMGWMEHQGDCEHIHLMHMVAIKQYALKKRFSQLRQVKVSDFFVKTT